MKKINCISFLIMCLLNLVKAQHAKNDVTELITVENAFASKAFEAGTKNAFLAYLDSNGVLFNGGDPVNGIELYRGGRDDAKDVLSWFAVIAHVAASGDLGFTSGPYQHFPEKGVNPVGSGYFFSIWKRNETGDFKLLLDMGAPNSKNHKEAFIRNPKPENGKYNYGYFPNVKNEKRIDPWEAEKKFSDLAGKNPIEAYQKYLSKSSWTLRNDNPASKDKSSNLDLLKQQQISAYQFTQIGKGLSKAHDFAYCYGSVNGTGPSSKSEKNGLFVRVWQYQGDGWKIIAEEVSLF